MLPRKSKHPRNTVPLGTIPRRRLDQAPLAGSEPVAGSVPNYTPEPRPSHSAPPVNYFQRNRNLAANPDKSSQPSERLSAHQLRRRRRRIMLSLTTAIIVAAVIFAVLSQMIFVVKIVLPDQLAVAVNQQSYVASIEKYFADRPTQRLRELLSLPQLTAYLNSAGFPAIKAVTAVRSTGLGSAAVTITMRQPIASWQSDNGQTQYVDSQGVVFQTNYFATPTIKIVDQSGASTASGSVVASGQLLQFIGLVTGDMRAYGYTIRQVDLPPNTTREVDLILSNGKRVKMTIDRSAGDQSQDAERALKYFTTHGVSFSYVDVRVSREAYYQ